MKILRQPKFKPCLCMACGTWFQAEGGDKDTIYSEWDTLWNGEVNPDSFRLFAFCPICGYSRNKIEIDSFCVVS